ncbi:hypothetical protein SAMN04487996_1119 [Dyadobacter soli]|uniref:mRNA interferase RelE/StbE n=1 Tax=Dyadobacter soli TaxID=659014 RepID=A0A1G7LJU8_9BACT|nr:hypothetical protein SAMN04487996_1119 [Dyadobacter soli]
MRYKISYEKHALKELKRLPSKAVGQILRKINSLAENPYQAGIRKLSDSRSFSQNPIQLQIQVIVISLNYSALQHA